MPGNPFKVIFSYKVIPLGQQECLTCTALGSGPGAKRGGRGKPGLREAEGSSPALQAVCHCNVSLAWL